MYKSKHKHNCTLNVINYDEAQLHNIKKTKLSKKNKFKIV